MQTTLPPAHPPTSNPLYTHIDKQIFRLHGDILFYTFFFQIQNRSQITPVALRTLFGSKLGKGSGVGSTSQCFMISRHNRAQTPWRVAWLRKGGHFLHFPIFRYKIGAKLRPWHYEHCLGRNLARGGTSQ